MRKEKIDKIKSNFWWDADVGHIKKTIDRETDTYKQTRIRSDELDYIKNLARRYAGGNVSLLMVYATLNFPYEKLEKK